MDELNNLVKNELKNLRRNEELLANQILMGTTDSYKSSSTCNEISEVSWVFFVVVFFSFLFSIHFKFLQFFMINYRVVSALYREIYVRRN